MLLKWVRTKRFRVFFPTRWRDSSTRAENKTSFICRKECALPDASHSTQLGSSRRLTGFASINLKTVQIEIANMKKNTKRKRVNFLKTSHTRQQRKFLTLVFRATWSDTAIKTLFRIYKLHVVHQKSHDMVPYVLEKKEAEMILSVIRAQNHSGEMQLYVKTFELPEANVATLEKKTENSEKEVRNVDKKPLQKRWQHGDSTYRCCSGNKPGRIKNSHRRASGSDLTQTEKTRLYVSPNATR